ncbi:MAG: penicillin-binding transpeptidase domain-containing protein, partial [Mycobacteriales bacterium]
EALATTARKFGIGSSTGVDLSNDLRGKVLDREYKIARYKELKAYYCRDAQTNPDPYIRGIQRDNCADGDKWLPGDEVLQYIGQGETAVTPLQLAVAYTALANGGTIYAPRLAKAVVGAGQKVLQRVNPKVRGRLGVDDAYLRYIRSALSDVTKTGTAQTAFRGFPFGQVEVAGKTGTAESGYEKRAHPRDPLVRKQDTSWFASFGGRPGQPAKYVVLVMVEQAGQGGRVAAPTVREIWEGMYGLGGRPAALPHGETPTALPRVLPDGSVARPSVPPSTAPAPAALGTSPALDDARRRRAVW